MANSNAVQQQEVDGAESIVAAAEGTETADSAPPSNEQAAEEAPVPRETAFDAAKAAERSDKYKSLFFFEQDTLRAAEGEDSQGSASSRIAPVLKASSVTEMVVPPELVVEVPIVTASDAGLGVAGDSIPVVAITPFSRGSSLQDIVVPDAVGESPVSEASDATLLKGSAPKVPARPRKASAGKGPEGVPSIIPARFVQSLANAEAGKSASIRAMRDSHSVSKMLKQFEQASVADESIPSPRSRSVSGQRP
ncbi:hypothetical protein DFJ74DRAFT_616021 [Hyaloraphidium curvatum]|nr:hypothetical protein DFJ74DRAFT_616021 [Hyaloraphidium curvatum]